jgi:hypothetical protein
VTPPIPDDPFSGLGDVPHDPFSSWEDRPPPSGGDPHGAGSRIEHQCVAFCPICRGADVLRAAAPPEFQEHWQALQREGLLAARALIDHYIRHLESQRASAAPVEDIPIE